MDEIDVSGIIAGLATVTLAALAVSNPGAAALGAWLALVRPAIERNRESKRAQMEIIESISSWARGEGLNSDLVAGISLATMVMDKYGIRLDEFKSAEYDPDRAAKIIINRAAASDHAWTYLNDDPVDPAYHVARRAIRAALNGISGTTFRVESAILPAIRKAAEDTSLHLAAYQQSSTTKLDNLTHNILELTEIVAELTSSATNADLIHYLSTRIQDWDSNPWRGARQLSSIERQLTVTPRHRPATRTAASTWTRDSLYGVILGAPGSGKTWLARSIARDAATQALKELQEGASLESVEIPILTTWDSWTRHEIAGTRASLVDSSFSPLLGLSDLGDGYIEVRVRRYLTSCRRALVVIDSLDESRDQGNVPKRAASLDNLSEWRTFVTSRHGQWDAKLRNRDDISIAELDPLSFQDDVIPFITNWFAHSPQRANALIWRIRGDVNLRHAATNPLLMTFFCLHAERSPIDAPLPTLPRELYGSVIDQLLTGDWREAARPVQTDRARTELRRMAMGLVDGRTSVPYLQGGEIPYDDFVASAMDHVAPLSWGPSGKAVRIFRHRTLMEYLAGEWITTLSRKRAQRILTRGICYDSEQWETILSAGIGGHAERDRLLGDLVHSTGTTWPFSPWFEKFALGLCIETRPEDWSGPNQTFLNGLRLRSDRYELLGRSSHWLTSNSTIAARLVKRILSAETTDEKASSMMRSLDLLCQGANPRSEILNELISDHIENGDSLVSGAMRMASVLEMLQPDLRDMDGVRRLIIEYMKTSSRSTDSLINAAYMLDALAPSTEERHEAMEALARHAQSSPSLARMRQISAIARQLGPDPETAESMSPVFNAALDHLVTSDDLIALSHLISSTAAGVQLTTRLRASLSDQARAERNWQTRADLYFEALRLRPSQAEALETLAYLWNALPTIEGDACYADICLLISGYSSITTTRQHLIDELLNVPLAGDTLTTARTTTLFMCLRPTRRKRESMRQRLDLVLSTCSNPLRRAVLERSIEQVSTSE